MWHPLLYKKNPIYLSVTLIAPIAAGKPKPIVPSPPDVINCLFLFISKNCVVHIWCWPTSVTNIPSVNTLFRFSNIDWGEINPSTELGAVTGCFLSQVFISSTHCFVLSYMYYFCIWRKFGNLSCNSIVKSCTNWK